MGRFPKTPPTTPRSSASLADERDLRGAIRERLASGDPDECALQQAVWNYVGAERAQGISSGRVILVLTELLEAAKIRPLVRQQVLLRNMILWCVEAYFGHLGGDVFRSDRMAGADDALSSATS